ncbi:hypothetical protein [Cellulomonas terrae]|uniref:Uncharacterized protein n=1 Tax=Cellulomonas terrae TaxID=311234 RepID=A0A511JMU6_9CELL|nr:hypothetical protein [Cellulomonas terrae]GEL99296.1 hypothetical protein CTE05_28430 [Cellulomonas terrae]
MRVLYDDLVDVDYGFLELGPDYARHEYFLESRGGQRNGLCGAQVPGHLTMAIGLNDGEVPVRVEVHEVVPSTDPVWEDVVEVSFAPIDAPYTLTAFQFGVVLDLPVPGTYRARWSASGMDAAHANGIPEGGSAPDRYLLQLWPAPWGPDEVVRQSSKLAAYWHSVAAETPPPPPPPTPEEVAVALARQEEEDCRAALAHAARLEALHWGGRPPTDDLRAWGSPAAQLAHQDRALLDDLATLTPEQQREVALWTARRACDHAGVADRPEVVEALRRVARGEPSAPFWQEWSSAWDAVFPPEPGEVVETVVTLVEGVGHVSAAAPEMAAVGALMAVTDPHAGRAVAGAVDYLGHSLGDPRTSFDEVRDLVARLRATGGPPT